MKRILLLFSALMLSCIALWAHDVEIGGIYYNLDETNKTAEVTYRGNVYDDYDDEYSGSVTIPETITCNSEIYSVTSIGSEAFYKCTGLTSVTIGNSVSSIGHFAFQRCSGLTSVTIPNSVTSIGHYAFYDTGIYNNNSNWDNGVLYIDNCLIKAKYDVVKGSYTIKEGTRVIVNEAFYGCSGLTSVTIPNSVTSIGSAAFYNCSGLTKVNYLGTVDKWLEIDFGYNSNPTYYAKDLYINNELLTDVKITSADSIKDYAFYRCRSIKSVEIGNSVTSIGQYAFEDCSGLTSVIWNAKNYKDFSSYSSSPFYNIRSKITSFTFGNEVEHIPAYLCYEMNNLKEVTIGKSVTSIVDYTFQSCSGLTKVNYLGTVDKWVEIDFENSYSNPTFYAEDLYINNELLTDVKITTADSIKNYAFYYCKSIKSVEIGNSVTSIGKYAFSDCSGLTSVIWNAKNYKDLSYSPFYDICSSITSFTFGNEIEHIPAYLCYGMSKLTEITIPNSVTSIGSGAFYGCSGLTSVTIPNSVTSIGSAAFYGCSGLTSVTIPNSVTSIGDEAFEYCSGLTKVNYLGTVDKWVEIDFDDYASNPTYYTEDLYINNELLTDVKLTSADSIKNYAFYHCQSIKSVEIGNSVKSIGKSAFSGCSGLTSVTIPNSVTSIGERAFRDCSGLTSVIWNAKNYKDLSYSPFYDICSSITSFTFGNEIEHIPAYLCYGMSKLTEITIPNSVTSIGKYAFSDCSGLTSVIWNAKNSKDFEDYDETPFYNIRLNITSFTFGNEVEHIPAYLCYDTENLKEVTIGKSVTSIGGRAFEYCSGLTSITIPNSVTSIGGRAFEYCSGLTSITIPNSVTSIGKYAFYDCSGLTSVTIGESVTSIGDVAFSDCSRLTSVIWNAKNCEDFSLYDSPFYDIRSKITSFTFGNEVEHIPAHLCYEMSKLTEITIPNSVTSIGKYAFEGCSGLTSVIWNAKNYKDLSYSPFYDICSSITSFTFGNEIEHIPAYLCYGMSKLTEITIPNSVTSIGSGAFEGCSGLTSVTIGESVTYIGSEAFYKCSGLTKVNYLGSVDKWVEFDFKSSYSNPTFYAKDLYINNELLTDVKITTADSIKNYAFYNCQSIKSVEIGNSVTSIGYDAFYNCSGLTSVIWNAKNCADFEDYDETPFYYIRSSITSFTFGNEVEHIPAYLCYGMNKLTEMTIPKNVVSIGASALYCSGLTKVNYLGNVDKWVEIDFNGYDSNPTYYAKDLYVNNELLTDVKITTADSIKGCAFINCQSIKSVEIGKSVTSIGKSAFNSCSGLTEVTIGNSVTSISSSAFSGCSGLTKVNYLGTVDKWVDIDFEDYYSNPTYYAKDLYINNELLTDVKITSADSIKGCAFYYCQSIKSVEIGNSVTSIGSFAFEGCSGLTSVIWNAKNYKDFSSSTYSPFYDIRSSITSFTFGNEIEHIPAYLCYGMSKLTGITIPNSVTSIGEDAFDGCDKLRKVTAYPTTVPNAYESSFAHYNAYLYVPCDVYEDYDLDDVFGNFKYIKCIAAEEVDAPDKVEIEVDEDNNAIVIWPSTDGAKKYELEISKDGEVFCTLLFNENGQLTSIDFGNRSASVGFQFTVTGLDSASKYAYSMVAMDKKGNELQSYKGTFTTNGSVDITENLADANITVSGGKISAEADFSIYNTIGQDVTAFNGSLQPGIYLVSIENDIVKVMVH